MNAYLFYRTVGFLALLLAACQGGCCCFECIPHGTAPLKYVPPISATTLRNPPCSFVDPLCYGYHATCWRSWPADCVPNCAEWYQHDMLAPPKGDAAPMPPAPAPPEAPLPTAPQPAESSSLSPVRQAADYAALPPVITVRETPIREPGLTEDPSYSSRRSALR